MKGLGAIAVFHVAAEIKSLVMRWETSFNTGDAAHTVDNFAH